MRVAVVTAWKDLGDPARRTNYEFTRSWWAVNFPDWEHVIGTPEPFTRARGLNAAVAATSADVIVQADPDAVAPAGQLERAVAQAAAADGLVVPFTEYLYLTAQATVRLQQYRLDDWPRLDHYDCESFGEGGCGPMQIFSRRTWETVGGYDERFGLWGGDDGAFAYACDAFFGDLRREEGPVAHCWHPRLPQSMPGTEAYAEQFAILAEWRDASRVGPAAVKRIVEALRG